MKLRWVGSGLLLGALPALLAFAPAAWLADGVTRASGGRVRLAEATGTVWAGDAVLALASGTDARQALALPGRLHWRVGLHAGLPAARIKQACCIHGQWVLQWQPGLQRQRFSLLHEPAAQDLAADSSGAWGQWPLSALTGLGTPWNTMRLNGSLQLTAQPVELVREKGLWSLQGDFQLHLNNLSSRLSPLETLGSYSLSFSAQPGAPAALQLQTLSGALQLQGQGQWTLQGLRFQAQASAAPGSEDALNNLLNIIGVRQGAQSVFSIG